ncbi:hypothetical protein D3C71_1395710 [compost metagenome]
MNVLEQRLQVVCGVSGFGDGIDHRLHGLGELALGDVVRHRQPPLLVRQPARSPADVRDGAILAHIAVFKLQLQMAIHHTLRLALGDGQVFRVHQVEHAFANDFLGGVAKDALERRAYKLNGAVHMDDADRVEQQVHHVLRRDALHEG